jgi:hypothetical protein
MAEPAAHLAEPLAVSLDRLAELTSVSRRELYREAGSGRLRVRKIGARSIVTLDDGRSWLAAR